MKFQWEKFGWWLSGFPYYFFLIWLPFIIQVQKIQVWIVQMEILRCLIHPLQIFIPIPMSKRRVFILAVVLLAMMNIVFIVFHFLRPKHPMMGDMNKRRGRVHGMIPSEDGSYQIISCKRHTSLDKIHIDLGTELHAVLELVLIVGLSSLRLNILLDSIDLRLVLN